MTILWNFSYKKNSCESFALTIQNFKQLLLSVILIEIFTRMSENLCQKQPHERCSMKKAVLKNFVVCFFLESLFYKGLNACNFILKKTPTRVFSCEYCEILKTPFLKTSANGCFCCAFKKSTNKALFIIKKTTNILRLFSRSRLKKWNTWIQSLFCLLGQFWNNIFPLGCWY